LFVGTPDNNSAAATENISIEGLTFEGENVQHALSGTAPMDYRCAIMFKNSSGTTINDCTFTKIDSSAVYYQQPAVYNYVNAAYFNTTKNYDSTIVASKFYAESHAVASRALIHAIGAQGVDKLVVDVCHFEWCDDVLDGEGTYETIEQAETSTWTPSYPGWTLGAVKRSGRDWVFSNNVVYNSSEHAVYASGCNVVISGNIVRTDTPSVCLGDIRVRTIGGTIAGNTVVSGQTGACIAIREYSTNVTVTGNVCYANSSTVEGGAIQIQGSGITTYIDNRPWFSQYYVMDNIVVTGNSVTLPETASSALNHVGIRVYTDEADANYPEGQVRNVTIVGNTVKNHRHGVYLFGVLARNVVINDNTLDAKPFVSAGFAAGTTLDTETALLVRSTSTSACDFVQFRNNTVNGATYLFSTHNGAGTSVAIPWGITNNYLYAIKNFKTADMVSPVQYNTFRDNTGYHFLDRTGWVGAYSLNNSLGTSASSNTERKYNLAYNGTNVIFYTDDSGTTITL
jgi:hypothetical protein